MDKRISDDDVQAFISNNHDKDIDKLALSKNPFPDVNWHEIIKQIAAKEKAKFKLPTWFEADGILYPSRISLEQTSSETTAKYKASLVSGENLIDITGGFGVDCYFFAQNVSKVVHCELNDELSEIVRHNFKMLKQLNIECYAGDSHYNLRQLNLKYDWIYIDPSRRSESKGKVFKLEDCIPDVPSNLDFYYLFSDKLLIKTSPMLDISAGLSELKNVRIIHVVAVKNEVKELLWEVEKGYDGPIIIKAIDTENPELEFLFTYKAETKVTFGATEKYLYEPNAAILKSGGFDQVAQQFNLVKLHPHTHLYTSDQIIPFPGRTFEILEMHPYNKASYSVLNTIRKANITTRNFPISVDSIRKKHKITDGGNTYCFFTTGSDDSKIVLLCTKII